MEVVQALKEGRALIEKGWTQGAFSRNELGWPLNNVEKVDGHYRVPGATEYCTMGSAATVTWEDPRLEEGTRFSAVVTALGEALTDLWELEDEDGNPIPLFAGETPWDPVTALREWNDAPGRSKNEVLRLWTRAIQLVEA